MAGKRYEAGSNGFRTAVKSTMIKFSSDDNYEAAMEAVEIVEYRFEAFHTPQGDISFWTPTTQTPFQTMVLLLEAYERTLR